MWWYKLKTVWFEGIRKLGGSYVVSAETAQEAMEKILTLLEEQNFEENIGIYSVLELPKGPYTNRDLACEAARQEQLGIPKTLQAIKEKRGR